MRNENIYHKKIKQNKVLSRAGLTSFFLGESEAVKNNPILSNGNTIAGLIMSGYSMLNAFRILDQLDGKSGDEVIAFRTFFSEFVLGPFLNSILLSYSLAPEDQKLRLRHKLGLDSRGE